MKVVALVSGGKDSCYAMMRCIDYGHEIVALANLMPLDDSIDELDSYMYQTVGHQIVVSYAECMGLPLFRRRIHGIMRHENLNYLVTPGDEVEDMFILLNEVKRQIPSIAAVSSGAIASDYQRLRVESVCSRLGLVSLAYLWRQDQTLLLDEMIRRGIVAITIKVAALGLVPAKHLGKPLAELRSHLLEIMELYGINVCGEGGEYETLTLDCPLFVNARIVLDKFQVCLLSPDSIAPVGLLHRAAFHLEHKEEVPPSVTSNRNAEINGGCAQLVHEVMDCKENYLVRCKSKDMVLDSQKSSFHTSRVKEILSLGFWVQGTCVDMKEDLTVVFGKVELELHKDGFDWADVLYIHLYISDMKEFVLANEVYTHFITEKNCFFGVPSRSTIELPLVQAGLGNAYVEVLVANDRSKRVLHVQSISCWAPSCIGPYSQATLHKEILYMAGQLGLDPPSMMLQPGGLTAELHQALENCEAVASCFNSSICSSSVEITVYCSASLTYNERIEIKNQMQCYFKAKASKFQHACFPLCSVPIFVYVLAPNLPKGALVELKPVLHIPESKELTIQSGTLSLEDGREELSEVFENADRLGSCCQKYILRGKLCVAMISITNDVVGKIHSVTDQDPHPIQSDGGIHTRRLIVRFCVRFLNNILVENGFSWDDLMTLRFYFTADFAATADELSPLVSEVLAELAFPAVSVELLRPMFSLIPVLASGASPSMEDVVSCEMFASKRSGCALIPAC